MKSRVAACMRWRRSPCSSLRRSTVGRSPRRSVPWGLPGRLSWRTMTKTRNCRCCCRQGLHSSRLCRTVGRCQGKTDSSWNRPVSKARSMRSRVAACTRWLRSPCSSLRRSTAARSPTRSVRSGLPGRLSWRRVTKTRNCRCCCRQGLHSSRLCRTAARCRRRMPSNRSRPASMACSMRFRVAA